MHQNRDFFFASMPKSPRIRLMKYSKQHAGKWVAVKNDKVIAMSAEFGPLRKKVNARRDRKQIQFSHVPRGYIAG